MITLSEVRRALSAREPVTLASGEEGCAAVALVLHERRGRLEVLFIRRARRKGDPWSGQIAFPGGRMGTGDASPRAAAERETREELALDLTRAEYLGRLDDRRARPVPLVLSAFVYHAMARGPLRLDPEVAAAFWVGLEELCRPDRRDVHPVMRDGKELLLPAIALGAGEGPPLWGLTYRLLADFLAIVAPA